MRLNCVPATAGFGLQRPGGGFAYNPALSRNSSDTPTEEIIMPRMTVAQVASPNSGLQIVEREVPYKLASATSLKLALKNPDFTTAARVAAGARGVKRGTRRDGVSAGRRPGGRRVTWLGPGR